MTNRQLKEQFGRGTAAYAERSAARSQDRPAAPEVEYFLENGQYMATDGIDIEPAQRAELEDIAKNGTVQENGRVRFGYHAGLAESDLLTMPTAQPQPSALADYVGSGNALARHARSVNAFAALEAERDGYDR
ncbi:hypothetical protein [Nocardia sp. A7]|uniref:hypothetical protein n=1 Tax=Nocardia sp. A7 TaxID=2789274 RepID=UPI00397D6FA9